MPLVKKIKEKNYIIGIWKINGSEYNDILCEKIATSHDKATKELKKIFWEGTEHWDDLLSKRAKISGELILSNFSKEAIAKIKGK